MSFLRCLPSKNVVFRNIITRPSSGIRSRACSMKSAAYLYGGFVRMSKVPPPCPFAQHFIILFHFQKINAIRSIATVYQVGTKYLMSFLTQPLTERTVSTSALPHFVMYRELRVEQLQCLRVCSVEVFFLPLTFSMIARTKRFEYRVVATRPILTHGRLLSH